jgi:signal transduction histidine kinase
VSAPRDPDRRARRLVWLGAAGFVFTVLLTVVFSLVTLPPPAVPEEGGGSLAFLAVVLPFPVAGLFILARQPRNHVGWILLAIGYAWVQPLSSIGEFAMSRSIPGGAELTALAGGTWAPPIVLMGTVLLLRFPNGELLSPRWRWVERMALVVMVVILLTIALSPGDFAFIGYPDVQNPLAFAPIVRGLLPVALLCLPVAIVLSAISLVIRFRRSRGIERLQMKWLTTAAAVVALLYLIGMVASMGTIWEEASESAWMEVLNNLSFLSFLLIPVAIAIAVLRYRLYEIDVVINKAIVYGALAAFVTASYVGIVVGIGYAIGSERSVTLSIAATILVAVAFQPIRERVQRFANRLVYGKRATPYEVLAGFAEQVAGTFATDEIATAIARLLVEGTGADRAEIWLRTGDEPQLEAMWPDEERAGAAAIPENDDLTRVAPVVHRGETLADLVLRKEASDPIGPADEKLLEDVAGQAGLVLRNVHLIEDLRASRQRLVAARDTERRKLERNIHDGAQQRLVALAVLYNMAAGIAKPLGEEHQAAIAELGQQTQAALETLRDLARGIYPAVLSDGGLIPALRSQARTSPMPLEIEAESIGRYGQEVEAAVYFCCLEALQNVAKYAGATRAVVRLSEVDGEVRFEVVDDGAGFDAATVELGSGTRNMQDRLAAFGGSLEVRSAPGAGTTVIGRVPVPREAPALATVG